MTQMWIKYKNPSKHELLTRHLVNIWANGMWLRIFCIIMYYVYDKFNAPKWLPDCMISVELKWHTNEQVQWPGGNM